MEPWPPRHPLLIALALVATFALAGLGVYLATSGGKPGHPVSAGKIPQVPKPPPSPAPTPDAAEDEVMARIDRAFNPGWIGASCGHDLDCAYPGGFCLMPEEGFPRGYCSARCRRFCPDRQGAQYSTTYCVEDPTFGNQGTCLSMCNLHLAPSGCRPGYVCTTLNRFEENATELICLPDRGTPPPPTACTQALDALAVAYARPDLADAPSVPARPGDPPPRESFCQIDTPVLLASPLHGVDFRERGQRQADHLLVACPMALALEKLAALLARNGVVEIEHNGTYNCRGVAGTKSLSGHGRAMAIDVVGFERARGAAVNIARDWSGPDPAARRFLRDLAGQIRDAGLFPVLLTPASNAAHQDHLHLEVR